MSETTELKVIDERTVLGKNFRIFGTFEEPLFLAKDVAEWIEHSNTAMMLATAEDNEKVKIEFSTINNAYSREKNLVSEAWFLTEDGLYEVLMLSRKPVAKEFKKQVKEILKTIRKTGGFVADNREPEFVAKYFPSFSEDVKLMMVQDLLNKQKQLQIERDEAIRTKAFISDKKTATAMGRVGGLVASNN
jgi:Prophage antirepressor